MIYTVAYTSKATASMPEVLYQGTDGAKAYSYNDTCAGVVAGRGTVTITLDDEWKDEERVCVFCDSEVLPLADSDYYLCCDSYKGVMTVREWEAYTNEVWER